MHLWLNLLGIFYPMPLWGRIALPYLLTLRNPIYFRPSFIHVRESNALDPYLFTLVNPMLQTQILTLGRKPLILIPIYKTHIHLRLTHPHNTSLLYYFLPCLQIQTLYHICFLVLCLLHNMSSSSVKWLVHYDGQIIKTNERDTFQSPHPLFFETKRGLEKKNLGKALSSTMDQVCNISF